MSNDFDFLLGQWKVMNFRLKRWLKNCREWEEFESFHEERRLTSGPGTVALHQYIKDQVPYERSVLRSYNEKFDFWKIDRLDERTSLVMNPLTGTFWENKGSFISHGYVGLRDVLVHVEWTKICKTFASWEQALSKDGGKTWETNWVMEFHKKVESN